MFTLKHLKQYKKRPICIDVTSNKYLYFNDVASFKNKISKIIDNKCIVFLIYENNLDFISIYLSILNLNIVPLILNERIHKSFLDKLEKQYKPRIIFYPNKIYLKNRFKSFSEYYSIRILKKEKFKIDKKIALMISTSGTTGSSKNVVCSYNNLTNVSKSISDYLTIKKNDKPLMTLPMNYVYGLSVFNSHLYKCATMSIISENFLNRDFWKLIEKNKISTFPTVPYQLEILDKIKFNKFNLDHLKYLTVAGGNTPNKLLRKIYEICKINKIKLYCMYGQAEATSRISYLNPKYLPKKLGSIGKAIPRGKIYLIDKKNKIISKNYTKGQLVYSGKNIMLGYSNSFADLKSFPNKIKKLFTGDIGYKDKDNLFYISGRQVRDMKIFGNRINLDELENLLNNYGYNCRCVDGKSFIKVFFNKKNKKKQILKVLLKLLNINLMSYRLIYIKDFPLGPNKKVNYSALKYIK